MQLTAIIAEIFRHCIKICHISKVVNLPLGSRKKRDRHYLGIGSASTASSVEGPNATIYGLRIPSRRAERHFYGPQFSFLLGGLTNRKHSARRREREEASSGHTIITNHGEKLKNFLYDCLSPSPLLCSRVRKSTFFRHFALCWLLPLVRASTNQRARNGSERAKGTETRARERASEEHSGTVGRSGGRKFENEA